MPRKARAAPGGYVYHVLNRGVGRRALFEKDADYAAFEAVLGRAREREPGVALLTYCLMPNHWHLVVRPSREGELGAFMHWLTLTHTRRWQEHRRLHGSGHVYQGRYKSFPVQWEVHLLAVCQYVERNAARAGLVERAEAWRWSGLWVRRYGDAEQRAWLSPWPIPGGVPRQWLRTVNASLSEAELTAVRRSVARGRPYGTPAWTTRVAERMGLGHTLRSPGRPRKDGGSGAA